MTGIGDWLASNSWTVVGGIGAVVLLYFTYKYQEVRLTVYALMLYVEDVMETEEGQKKKQAVITAVHSLIPNSFRWLFPEKTLDRWIDSGMGWLEDYLDDGQLNNSNDRLTEQITNKKIELEHKDRLVIFNKNIKF